MTDLRGRFESLSRMSTPDLWPEIEVREPSNPIGPSSVRRVVVAVAALVVAAAGIGIAAVAFGGSELRTGSEGSRPVPIANGPIYFRVGGGDGGSRIEAVQPDGSGQRVVFEGEPMWIAQIAWSPDGTRIAYQDPIAEERGIFVADSDGGNVVRLTEGANDAWPSWSPDGSRIVFSSTRYDPTIPACTPGEDFKCPTDLYISNIDGSSIARLTTDSAAEYQPVWSPNGDRIAFSSSPGGYSTVVSSIGVDGAERLLVSSGDGGSDFWPSWSPDGSQIVFAAIRNEDWGIWAVDADGSNERMILGGTGAGYVDNPIWSPDGSLIAFVGNLSVDDYSPEDAVYVMRPDGTDVTPIADAPSIGVAGDIAWQPIPEPAETVEPTPSPPTSAAEVVETFAVGQDVRSVVYGDGSVWVAASNVDGTSAGHIVRIDPETHEVQADIPVEVIPTWEIGGGAMVVDSGSLWVTGAIGGAGVDGISDAAVIRIDASTNEVVTTFDLGGHVGADIALLDGDLWVLLFGDESVDQAMEVVRVDPGTGHVLARFTLDAAWAHSLVAADGRLITIVGGENAVNEDGRMIVIDPAASEPSRIQMPSRYHSTTPVLWRGQGWVSLEPGFIRFDPLTEEFIQPPIMLPARYADCCGFIEGDDRGFWFVTVDSNGGPHPGLVLFDPASAEVTELATLDEGSPVALAVAPDSVWILNYEGTLTHVDLG